MTFRLQLALPLTQMHTKNVQLLRNLLIKPDRNIPTL